MQIALPQFKSILLRYDNNLIAASDTDHNSGHAGSVLGELVENYSLAFEQNAADRPVEGFEEESFQHLVGTKLCGLLS